MADLRVYEEIQNADQSGNELLAHVGLVKRVALHLKGRLPNFMELDELIQVGMIGLIEAKSSFDASKGVDFEVFAKNRVRGAILDQVRKMSYLPRSAIVNIRDHNQASAALSGELGREASQTELAEFMGKDMDSFQKERTHAHRFQTVSLESQLPDTVDMQGSENNEPEANMAEEQFMESLMSSIDSLPERDRTVISLYYVEEMNLKEIGAVLEVSESRVSQILSGSVKKLRQNLDVDEQ
ncbi:RNA polymerase sigma factor FliA [Porticoccaceae bacterium]|nr:RNA polymerase sigma factor FliA [Porticoccaceae bacterium]MDB4077304.1 RNA polymerase sigma factor FliA [Porticoccaceae bacterium]MDB9999570.1 RNA polymerase sigma factor FliA [Porticoccaceae bacterium]MDC0004558.1 RNA polymerase sigma factor FliA [Porticoccaceae bacterium]